MSKREDLETTVDRLAIGFFRGEIGRRAFLRRLIAAGVTSSVAWHLTERLAGAAENQAARRAEWRDDYDVVIVGAGSAGSVLAHRLSEDPARRVLLLEAGGSGLEAPSITNPLLWFTNLGTPVDFARVSAPQAGLGGRSVLLSSGRILGGSGSINATIWLKPDARDFWAWRAAGGPRWRPTALERTFRKIETHIGGRTRWGLRRGDAGPVPVETPSLQNPLTFAFLDAARREFGLRPIDFNARRFHEGVGVLDYNNRDGTRVGPARAYLLPALGRPNLTVLAGARVRRLLMDGSRCRGVEALLEGEVRTFRAGDETIVSAGALGSPALLMRSGIGPAAHLRAVGAPVHVDLPGVGRNLQDHLLVFGVAFRTRSPLPPPLANASTALALRTRQGPEAPDVKLFTSNFAFGIPGLAPNEGYGVGPALMKPRSRGRLELTGTGPDDPLFIDPAYLQEPEDRAALVESLRWARELGLSSALSYVRAAEVAPGGDLGPAGNLAFLQQAASTFYHYVGTCAMGHGPDAVVDPELRVRGARSLRVVDASVIPVIPSTPTHVATLIVAERAADLLREPSRRRR